MATSLGKTASASKYGDLRRRLVFLLLAIFDDASMWMAVFADMGASLLVVFNGLRLLRQRAGQ